MKTITYNYSGTNEVNDFQEGNKIYFPGRDHRYIDAIIPTNKKGLLIMKTLYDRKPSLMGPRKHDIVEQMDALHLDEEGEKIISLKSIMASFSVKEQSTDYQEKLERLRELQGGFN